MYVILTSKPGQFRTELVEGVRAALRQVPVPAAPSAAVPADA